MYIFLVFFQSLEPTTSSNSYVDASAFRQEDIVKTTTEASIPIHPIPPPPVISSPLAFQPEGLGQEFDRAYFSTLDVFVHDF